MSDELVNALSKQSLDLMNEINELFIKQKYSSHSAEIILFVMWNHLKRFNNGLNLMEGAVHEQYWASESDNKQPTPGYD